MHLTHLSLQNFRNFVELEQDFAKGVTVLHGGNGQGKTNLLEAVSMFATAKSLRAGSERELIGWLSEAEEEIPYARVRGTVQRVRGPVQLDLVVQLARSGLDGAFQLQKRGRINGVAKRPGDIVGEVNAVLFTPQDIDLVTGPPSERRRYLNILLSQADPGMLRELMRYTRVLAQRNSLLRAIRDRGASAQELDFWDKELAESGSAISQQRVEAMALLRNLAGEAHRELTGGEDLDLAYVPSLETEEGEDVAGAFRAALAAARDKEVLLGQSLIGPHRDDFSFTTGGHDMAVYASRGQQRTASLALKFAEARFLAQRAADPPILLLDDVFSELDARRRAYLLSWIAGWEQALLTTAEMESLDRARLPGAKLLEVAAGRVLG